MSHLHLQIHNNLNQHLGLLEFNDACFWLLLCVCFDVLLWYHLFGVFALSVHKIIHPTTKLNDWTMPSRWVRFLFSYHLRGNWLFQTPPMSATAVCYEGFRPSHPRVTNSHPQKTTVHHSSNHTAIRQHVSGCQTKFWRNRSTLNWSTCLH